MSYTLGYKSGTYIVVSEELKYDFLINLFEVCIIIVTSCLMVKVYVVHIQQDLSDACDKDMSKLIIIYVLHVIFWYELLQFTDLIK